MILYLLTALAHAQEEIPVVEGTVDAIEAGQLLVEAVQSGNWTVAVALGLTLLIFVVRKYLWKSIPKKAIPYVTLGLATAAEVAVALYAGAEPLTAVLSGVMLGLAAVGGWEFIKGLGILKSPSKSEKVEIKDSPPR